MWRIVTRSVSEEERRFLAEASGYDDPLLAFCATFQSRPGFTLLQFRWRQLLHNKRQLGIANGRHQTGSTSEQICISQACNLLSLLQSRPLGTLRDKSERLGFFGLSCGI
jgi:hypothetical protein